MISAAGQCTLLGAPLDSSGSGRGEKNAPGALRAAGLVDALGVWDAGDADTILTDPTRDPVTGLIGFSGLVRASQALRSTLRGPLSLGARPLVIGGDCTILLGILAAMRDHDDSRIGLWFLDGHADFYDGSTSSTGEGADMELAIATGHGPAGLVDLAQPPLVVAREVVLLGHRRAEDDPDTANELGFLPTSLFHLDATTITEIGAARVGQEVEHRLASAVERAWLHLDLDVARHREALAEREVPDLEARPAELPARAVPAASLRRGREDGGVEPAHDARVREIESLRLG